MTFRLSIPKTGSNIHENSTFKGTSFPCGFSPRTVKNLKLDPKKRNNNSQQLYQKLSVLDPQFTILFFVFFEQIQLYRFIVLLDTTRVLMSPGVRGGENRMFFSPAPEVTFISDALRFDR